MGCCIFGLDSIGINEEVEMRIMIFTGARSEWGQLKHLAYELDKDHEVYLLVSGQHLSPTYGYTCREIDFDLLRTFKIEMLMDSDSPVGMAKGIGLGVLSYVETINRNRPDLFIVLGDRYESFAATVAAFTLGIPVGHVHGGETTLGSLDNGYRNAITQLATYHFAATGEYKRKIMQMRDYKFTFDSMNEKSYDVKVWNVGALGLEDVPTAAWPKSDRLFLAYHPVTTFKDGGMEHLENILSCLQGYEVYITGTNSDTHGRKINKRLQGFARWSPIRHFEMNYRRDDFLRLLNGCRAIIGNSSCGIIEAPSLKIGTIDVGPRQEGREYGITVLKCPEGTREQITQCLEQIYSDNFSQILKYSFNVYGGRGAAKKIKDKIQEMAISRD